MRGFCRSPGVPLCGLLGEPCCTDARTSSGNRDCFEADVECGSTFAAEDAVCVACGALGQGPCSGAHPQLPEACETFSLAILKC